MLSQYLTTPLIFGLAFAAELAEVASRVIDLSNFPQCALPCIQGSISSAGCDVTECTCDDISWDTIFVQSTACLRLMCPSDAIDEIEAAGKSMCNLASHIHHVENIQADKEDSTPLVLPDDTASLGFLATTADADVVAVIAEVVPDDDNNTSNTDNPAGGAEVVEEGPVVEEGVGEETGTTTLSLPLPLSTTLITLTTTTTETVTIPTSSSPNTSIWSCSSGSKPTPLPQYTGQVPYYECHSDDGDILKWLFFGLAIVAVPLIAAILLWRAPLKDELPGETPMVTPGDLVSGPTGAMGSPILCMGPDGKQCFWDGKQGGRFPDERV